MVKREDFGGATPNGHLRHDTDEAFLICVDVKEAALASEDELHDDARVERATGLLDILASLLDGADACDFLA